MSKPARAVPTAAPADPGNQETQRLLQRLHGGQTRVGRPDAAAEREPGHAAARTAPSTGAASPLAHSHGPGRPLDPAAQWRAQQSLGDRFADVRVHDDAAAATSARTLGAAAFTDGSHIAFGAGRYRPEQPEGWQLLEHELGHVARGDATPALLRRQALGPQIPATVTPTAAGVSFQLPGGRALTGGWHDLSTVSPTTVTLSVDAAGITLSFNPPLLIDVTYPISDIEWSSLRYSFATASVTSVGLASTQALGLSAGHGTASSDITTFFTGLLAGTRMATPGYDPLSDSDLAGTLTQIKTHFLSQPSSGGDITAADVSNVTLFANATIHGPLQAGAGTASLSLDGPVRVEAELQGTGAQLGEAVAQGTSPHVQRLTFSGAITVRSDGQDVARLEQLTMTYGGAVTVNRMTLLGSAATAAGVESAGRLMVLLLLFGGGTSSDRLAVGSAQMPDLDAQIVPGLARRQIEQGLSAALRNFIREHPDLIPGVDLTSVFGVSPMGDFPPLRPPAGPGSALG